MMRGVSSSATGVATTYFRDGEIRSDFSIVDTVNALYQYAIQILQAKKKVNHVENKTLTKQQVVQLLESEEFLQDYHLNVLTCQAGGDCFDLVLNINLLRFGEESIVDITSYNAIYGEEAGQKALEAYRAKNHFIDGRASFKL